jgi:hypothetical protein
MNYKRWEGERKISEIEDVIYEIAAFISSPKESSEDINNAILQLWSARRIYDELHVEYCIPNIREWRGIKYDVNEYRHIGAKGRPFKVKIINGKHKERYECTYLEHPAYPLQDEDKVTEAMMRMCVED